MTINSKSLADQLRDEAASINKTLVNKASQDIVEYIRLQAKHGAKIGAFEVRISLKNQNWNEDAVRLAVDVLHNVDKFKTEFKSEITDWYCNTDYNQEDVLYVRW